jgi:hypothetical protein
MRGSSRLMESAAQGGWRDGLLFGRWTALYVYRNFVGLIGFVTVLLVITAIFGLGMWTYAP